MLTRLPPAVCALILGTATTVALLPATASAGPCSGGVCANAGGGHSGGGGGQGGTGGTGGTGGGGSGGGGPNTGCGGITGQQCQPGNNNAPAPPVHIPTVDVLQIAKDKQALPVPKIHTSPRNKSYVRLKTSFWVGQAQFKDVSATAAVTDQTVTVTATKQSVTWNLGEATKDCAGMAATTPGACTYTYARSSAREPGGAYHITATINWTVTWTCTGTCDAAGGNLGQMTMPSPPLAFAVGEIQTESQPRN